MRFWGVFFFALVSLNLSFHILFEGRDLQEIFWFCNVMAVFLAYGFYYKKASVVNATLIMSIPAQFLWIADFFLEAFGYGLGRTSLLVSDSALYATVLISVTMHALIIPMSIWGSIKLGFSRFAYLWTLPIVGILLPATYLFTNPFENRNCVFFPCDLSYATDYQELISEGYMTTSYFLQMQLSWLLMFTASFLVLYVLFWKKRI